MKYFAEISERPCINRERSGDIRLFEVENIAEWTCNTKREWIAHTERIGQNRIVGRARDRLSLGKRSIGRSRKRWCDTYKKIAGFIHFRQYRK